MEDLYGNCSQTARCQLHRCRICNSGPSLETRGELPRVHPIGSVDPGLNCGSVFFSLAHLAGLGTQHPASPAVNLEPFKVAPILDGRQTTPCLSPCTTRLTTYIDSIVVIHTS